jgi:hypothetical protein
MGFSKLEGNKSVSCLIAVIYLLLVITRSSTEGVIPVVKFKKIVFGTRFQQKTNC